VTGSAVPRLTRRDIATFCRKILLMLEEDEITDVSIAFVDDEAMKKLNRQFRHKNKTTDVLTFPADETYGDPNRRGRPLGDIVISIDQARSIRRAVRRPTRSTPSRPRCGISFCTACCTRSATTTRPTTAR
jgi:probable rRNA maturation factor